MNDTQKYDLIADFNGKLQRISVKTSGSKESNKSFSVQLRNTGGNSKEYKTIPFDKNTCDYIFVYTLNEDIYLIPSEIVSAKNIICVGNKYKEYQVKIKTFNDFVIRNN